MNTRPRAWVLNLDAEHELDATCNYAPTLHLKALVEREHKRLLGTLVAPHDIVLTEDEFARDSRAARRAEGMPGIAWSPTPRALERLRAAGATPIRAPSIDVLRTVNARHFAAAVREPLALASFDKSVVTTIDDALSRLSRRAEDGWLIRRTFGAAGRGRRRIAAGTPSAAERAWLEASLRRGPLVIEPWVRITQEFTRSAWVHTDGEVVISAPCLQATTIHGAWKHTERAERGVVAREDDTRLEEAVAVAGSALARAGYFGPFGIDAYRHRSGSSTVLNPMSEINARFTMDWATAMAADQERGEALVRLDVLASR